MVPVIPEPQWGVQKYGNDPAVGNAWLYVEPDVLVAPAAQLVSFGEQNLLSAVQLVPDVTLWPLAAQVHRTVSPAQIVRVDGAKANAPAAPTVTSRVTAAPPSQLSGAGASMPASTGRFESTPASVAGMLESTPDSAPTDGESAPASTPIDASTPASTGAAGVVSSPLHAANAAHAASATTPAMHPPRTRVTFDPRMRAKLPQLIAR
jgi:hypothetical protein